MTKLLTYLTAVLVFGYRFARFVLEPDYIKPERDDDPVRCDAGNEGAPLPEPEVDVKPTLEDAPLPECVERWIKGKGLK
jgi:hypothetical protein